MAKELRVGSAGVVRTRVDVHVVGGKDALHSFCLLLNETVTIIGREQVVFLIRVFNAEVLDAHVQQLELGALVRVVRFAAVPAADLTLVGTVPLPTARRTNPVLDEGQSLLAIQIAHLLQSWWGYLVGEHVYGLTIPRSYHSTGLP